MKSGGRPEDAEAHGALARGLVSCRVVCEAVEGSCGVCYPFHCSEALDGEVDPSASVDSV